MNRNSLLIESLRKPSAPSGRSVWTMTMAVIGAAFGARGRAPGR